MQLPAVLAAGHGDPVGAELGGDRQRGQGLAVAVGEDEVHRSGRAGPAQVHPEHPLAAGLQGDHAVPVGPAPPPAAAAFGRVPAGAPAHRQRSLRGPQPRADDPDRGLAPGRQVVVERGREEAQVGRAAGAWLQPGHVGGVDEQVVAGRQRGQLLIAAVG